MYDQHHAIDRRRRTTSSTGTQTTDEENFSDETDPFSQLSSPSTGAWRRCRLHRLSTEVWRWPLADGFNMDDPAYDVLVTDRSCKPAGPAAGPVAQPGGHDMSNATPASRHPEDLATSPGPEPLPGSNQKA